MSTITSTVRTLRTQLGAPGLQTRRACNVRDILTAMQKTAQAKRRVRVYSGMGFVPNSYKYRCQIQYIEANLIDGLWRYGTGWTGAQRSRAAGTRVVVQ